jgi:hypothetical protein
MREPESKRLINLLHRETSLSKEMGPEKWRISLRRIELRLFKSSEVEIFPKGER